MKWILVGFLGTFVPYVIYLVTSNARARQNEERDAYKADRLARRRAAFEYRQMCRRNNLPVPMSTDEFYDGTEYRWHGDRE